jgi:hypothetical protein
VDVSVAVAWVAYILGIITVAVFLVDYLAMIKIWRPRPVDERPGVRRARRFILLLTGALALRYASGLATLIVTGGHPNTSTPSVVGAVLGVVVQVALVVMLQLEKRDARREAARR